MLFLWVRTLGTEVSVSFISASLSISPGRGKDQSFKSKKGIKFNVNNRTKRTLEMRTPLKEMRQDCGSPI